MSGKSKLKENSPESSHEASAYPSTSAVIVQDNTSKLSIPANTESRKIPRTASNASDYLVSEHEDNSNECRRVSSDVVEQVDSGIIASHSQNQSDDQSSGLSTSGNVEPAEIPLEQDDEDKEESENEEQQDEDEYESDYSYEDDDDDDGHYAGFLETTEANTIPDQAPLQAEVQVIEEEKPKVAEAEDTADENSSSKKSAWKEPSQQAISMSIRAEKEKSGGKRRLMADLYKAMTNDSTEAGYEVMQKDDSCMNKWTVKLFNFDPDSELHKDLLVLGLDHVELEMNFPDQVSGNALAVLIFLLCNRFSIFNYFQYPFEPPFVRVVRPRFKRQTGFVMNGALCMELLTNEGWNPVNDIESVIVSIRSLLVVGDGRLEAAANMSEKKREALLAAAQCEKKNAAETSSEQPPAKKAKIQEDNEKVNVGAYSTAEAKAAYNHLSEYHKKKGWSGWCKFLKVSIFLTFYA